MSDGRIIFVLTAGLLMTAGAIVVLRTGLQADDQKQILLGVAGTVFFGIGALVGLYGAWLRWGRGPN